MATTCRTWCSNIEHSLTNWMPRLEIPEGAITGIFASAVLSFGVNMVFSRCDLRLSLKGGGVAVLTKLIQLTIIIAQHHLTKIPEESTTSGQETVESEPTRLKYSIIWIQGYCSKSAAFIFCYLKKIPLPTPVLPRPSYYPLPSGDCYMAAALVIFSFKKITSPAVDPWRTILSTWIIGKMSGLSTAEEMPFCVVLKS